MRELQIGATSLDVDRRAEGVQSDRGAFDVPTRTTPSPGRLPRRLTRTLLAPHQAIESMPLAFALWVSPAFGEELLCFQHRHRSVGEQIGHAGHGEVPVGVLAIGKLVDRSMVLQLLDRTSDQIERLDDSGQPLRRQHPQSVHVVAVELDLLARQTLPVLTGGRSPFQQRVVHIGDVLGIAHAQSGVPPGAHQQIDRHIGEGMPQMRRVVRSDPAGVKPRLAGRRPDGLESSRPPIPQSHR